MIDLLNSVLDKVKFEFVVSLKDKTLIMQKSSDNIESTDYCPLIKITYIQKCSGNTIKFSVKSDVFFIT